MKTDIQLTPHFKLSEFTRSATAAARKIDNTPSIEAVSNLQQLCIHILEPLRAYANAIASPLGGEKEEVAINISSGYRSPALNKAVGGAANSQHMTGEAADIIIPSTATGRKWLVWLMGLDYDQLILEKQTPASTHYWIHVSYRQNGNNRRQVIDGLVKFG